jgi:hypothetical protein
VTRFFNYAHNSEWLARTGSIGQQLTALEWQNPSRESTPPQAQHPLEGKAHSYRYGRMRLIEILVKFELWRQKQLEY